MSRNAYLSSIMSIPTKIISKKVQDTTICDTYRTIEWNKYVDNYHNLLASTPLSHAFHTRGFFHLNGDRYYTHKKSTLPLKSIIKNSIVKRPKMIWLPCIDERIQYLTASHHALSLGIPGCECLMSYAEKLKMVQELIDICDQNPTIEEIVVSSHSGCGAVESSIRQTKKPILKKIIHTFKNKKRLIDKEGEKYALSFAHLLEQALQEAQLKVNIRTHHFHQKELHSQYLHHAFGAIVNFDPLLNSAEFEENLELPMFNIYAGGQNSNQILKNIDLAIAMSAGSVGFSCEYINKSNPFVLLFTVSNKNTQHIEQISSLIEKLQQKKIPLEIVYTVLETN